MNSKHTLILYIGILSVFAGSNCFGAIDGALSKIAEAVQISHTTAMYACSIATLASTFSSLVFGMIAGKKLPYRTTAIFCSALMIISGTAPFFTESFPVLLLTRFFFGIGIGGIMSMQNPIATKLLSAEKRVTILGVGTCVSFAFQCVMQLLGGVCADIQWNYVFFAYLVLLIPFVCMVLFLPKIEVEVPAAETEAREKFPLAAVLFCVVMGLVGLNIAPLLFGSAFYVAPLNDSAVAASIIAMLFSVGCMGGGLLFPVLHKRLKHRSLSVFLLLAAVGLLISSGAGNIVLLGVGFFMGGIGLACMQACIMLTLGNICTSARLGFASALMVALMNLGCFFCSAWETLIGQITGDALYAPLVVGAVIFAAIAIALLVKFPVAKECG